MLVASEVLFFGAIALRGNKPQFWSGSYAIISVGAQAPLEKLIEYVQNQENLQ
ncbi:transposase [Scytonema hofmannii]|uniref:transposase n=1 Tax=Scytonema hofmannii TaxID=34078 RepID=UPI00036ED654|nr:transposase [Scytonema hofmannii]